MNSQPTQSGAEDVTPGSKGQRVVAIDALRGFDMFWIVGGQQLALAVAAALAGTTPDWLDYQLEHVEWEGFSAWDLIMPLFLFVVGAAMPFSFSNRLSAGISRGQLYVKMLRRVAILFVLGMAVQGHLLDFDLSTLHIYCNTLQAIAAGYLIAGAVMLNFGVRGQLVVTMSLLVAYWLIMCFVPFQSHPAGTLQPHANVALAVDEFVLGRFRDGTTYTWILSSMTFGASVLLGVFAGQTLRSQRASASKFVVLASLGVLCLLGGWLWAEWLHFPIIKHIWTSSMVLWAGGWSYLLLALFFLMIDVVGWRRWAFPFVVIGMNAITIYVAHYFVPFDAIAEGLVGGAARHLGQGGSIAIAFASVLLVWLVVYHMYRQRIFVRV